jgi:O-methyltransferase
MTTFGFAGTDISDLRSLYLDLMKRSLLNLIYGHHELVPVTPPSFLKRKLVDFFATRGIQMVRVRPVDQDARSEGLDWPLTAHTMIGQRRLDNLQECVEDVLAKRIPGDLIETGVWRGGATILMRAVLKAYGVMDRTVWVADSFEGLPKPNAEKYSNDARDIHHTFRELAVPLDEVRANFERYGLLDQQVCFLKGWFRDTLPTAPIQQLAVIRLDGDMYESTMDALVSLYPKLSVGGYLIVDDYALRPCRQAVKDYRDANGVDEKIQQIDYFGVYWRRTR